MQRYKDVYYTEQMLDGVPECDGVKVMPPSFSTGESIAFSLAIQYNGQPINVEKHDLQVLVKKSNYAENVLWAGTLNDGLYRSDTDNLYRIIIPADLTGNFLPGIYYFDVKLTEKVGTSPEGKDLTVVLVRGNFTLEHSASSPNPKLRPYMVSEIVIDPTGLIDATITTVEPTLPVPITAA